MLLSASHPTNVLPMCPDCSVTYVTGLYRSVCFNTGTCTLLHRIPTYVGMAPDHCVSPLDAPGEQVVGKGRQAGVGDDVGGGCDVVGCRGHGHPQPDPPPQASPSQRILFAVLRAFGCGAIDQHRASFRFDNPHLIDADGEVVIQLVTNVLPAIRW